MISAHLHKSKAPTIFLTAFAILFHYITKVWRVKDVGEKSHFFFCRQQSSALLLAFAS
jgi:hypothetical protein